MRSETCRGERILCDFNVFFNKYVHELVTIDIAFTVFCIVCTVFLYCFVYVYLFLFVLSVLV